MLGKAGWRHGMLGLAVLAGLAPLPARAEVELSLSAIRETVEFPADGSMLIHREPVRRLRTGDTLEITLHYVNTGDDPVENVRLDNPVPEGTLYQTGSATDGEAQLLISRDGGETWAKATGEETGVTNLRWTLERLDGHAEGEVRFRLIALRGNVQLP